MTGKDSIMTPATPGPTPRRRGPLLISAAAFSLGGAAVYLAVLPALVQASLAGGLFFTTAGAAQVGLAVALLTAPSRPRLAAAAAISLAVVTMWALAHTTGLPGPNPWLPLDTAVGLTDVICAALQVVAVMLLGWAALRWPRARVRRPAVALLASAPPLLLTALLTLGGVAFATDGFTTVTRAGGPVPARMPAGAMTTLTYCTQHGSALAMDVYQPPAGAARPAPAALYVHGGGFIFGDRKLRGLGAALANHAGALVPQLRAALSQRGFVVASIDYRLPPLSRWPAPIEDTKCAVRFLRAHAAALGIDPGRIGAWGSSAGGDLASLLGVTGPRAGFDHGPYPGQSSAVQAVVEMFGAADATDLHDSEPFMRAAAQVALGSSTRARRSATPISYLGPGPNAAAGAVGGHPPFLILQPADDHGIRPRHSRAFAQRLQAAGIPARLVLVHGASHGLNSPSQLPTPSQLTQMITDFFTRHLASA
jgi:acetyl esterase/lipase